MSGGFWALKGHYKSFADFFSSQFSYRDLKAVVGDDFPAVKRFWQIAAGTSPPI